MHRLQPLDHLPPSSRHNALDIQRLARREAVTAVVADSGDWDAAGFRGDEVCAAAGAEKGEEVRGCGVGIVVVVVKVEEVDVRKV